jgi:predicted metal-dependent hydrolase
VVDGQHTPVKLEHGRFKMARSVTRDGREHMVRWYIARAEPWLAKVIAAHERRLGVAPTGITVQDLGYRWGSCGKGDRLYFHWRTILLPPRIVEYVAVHELVHLQHPHHTPQFWARVERVLPDFALRKAWLAENGRLAGF